MLYPIELWMLFLKNQIMLLEIEFSSRYFLYFLKYFLYFGLIIAFEGVKKLLLICRYTFFLSTRPLIVTIASSRWALKWFASDRRLIVGLRF